MSILKRAKYKRPPDERPRSFYFNSSNCCVITQANSSTLSSSDGSISSFKIKSILNPIANQNKQKMLVLLLFFTLLSSLSKSLTPVAEAEAIFIPNAQQNKLHHSSNITLSNLNLVRQQQQQQQQLQLQLQQQLQQQQDFPSLTHPLTKGLVKLANNRATNEHQFRQLDKHTTTSNQNSNLNSDLSKQSTASSDIQQPQHQKRLEKICMGTSNRMSGQHNKTDHYQSLADRYRNCTYVSGNLEITWLNKGVDLTFLESIREVTGYLLIAFVEVEKISMPNLQIIRGRDLFKLNNGEKEEFAMFLMDNGLKTLELPNLREILEGSFGSYNNRNLCHIQKINWAEILNSPTYKPLISYNVTVPECPPCDASCEESPGKPSGCCWGEGPEMCQKFSKINCSPQCSQGRCFGLEPRQCCHIHCAGGCTGPKQTDCLACKYFDNDGECIKECPSMTFYDPTKFSVEPNPNGRYAYGSSCVKECPSHLLRDREACVKSCPINKRSVDGECVPCVGPCPKNCQGVDVVHSGNIDQLVNCTEIEGSITILDTSFSGYHEVSHNNTFGTHLAPMHPSRLRVFETVQNITGYLNIQASHPDFKDLSFFKNLKVIGGRSAVELDQTLTIFKTSLVALNLHNLRKVNAGNIFIGENPDLCFVDTINWKLLNLTQPDHGIIIHKNSEAQRCRKMDLQCHSQCTRDGCWGSGPDECLSCNNYKLDSYCVDNCTSIHLPNARAPVLAFEAGDRTCKKCHPECSGGCTGTEARDCWQCRKVKDGPYCVSECPSHKYNNNGICEECDKSCVDGCTGPSNKLGLGGCNSCGKYIMSHPSFNRTTTLSLKTLAVSSAHAAGSNNLTSNSQTQCIRQEEPCPEGFYQEYVGRHADGPLKFAYGKPVCRKCHQRCKSCTGMGTHVSVCECSRYVAGEQCEDYCPRDYFPDEQRRRCLKCSSECNGCSGPTEADCISCRVYRIYYGLPSTSSNRAMLTTEDLSTPAGAIKQPGIKFNCTAHCPADKPHRISESNMLDPYCSEDPGFDYLENPRITSVMSSTYVLLMLILSGSIMACVFVYRCRLEKQKDKTVKLTMHLSGIDDVEPLTPSNVKPNLSTMQSIKMTELRIGDLLGEGFGGQVFRGCWMPENSKGAKIPVAIKFLRDNGQSNINKDFLNEAYMMATLNHPNLVSLLGICNSSSNLMLITKLMQFGCLLSYVREHKNEIGSKNLLEWCKQIAKGMAYLEEKGVVHRDLALRNVLLQTPCRALISDFGLAKLLDLGQSEYQSAGGQLPVKWLALECLTERVFTHKSDVWAFGVTVWECLTFGAKPFEKYDSKVVAAAILAGDRLEQPRHVTAEIYKVMYSCWFDTPQERPDFKDLAASFVNFAKDPQRYLSLECGDNSRPELNRPSDSDMDGVGLEEYSDIETMDVNFANTGAQETLIGPIDQTPQPRSATLSHLATATTAPSTPSHRINRFFDFESPRFQSESSEANGHIGMSNGCVNRLPSTPTMKKNAAIFQSAAANINGQHLIDQDFCQFIAPARLCQNQAGHLAESCSSVHNTVSTNSLGQKSEQPVDDDNYLLPSPCSNEIKFSKFLDSHPNSKLPPAPSSFSTRDPPHSAGLIGHSNQEYFLTRMNYGSYHSHNNRGGTQNASSGPIPNSLV